MRRTKRSPIRAGFSELAERSSERVDAIGMRSRIKSRMENVAVARVVPSFFTEPLSSEKADP
jgi:hypothetical protein